MGFKFIDIDLSRGKPKATIHSSGKLGFNIEAAKTMDLQNKNFFLLAQDEEDEKKIYLIENEDGKGAARVSKAGLYYYLNAGDAFDKLGFNYKGYTIIFDIAKDQYNNRDMYVLTVKREIKRNS